jgi:hypothetical protein
VHEEVDIEERPFDVESGDAGGDRAPVPFALAIVTAELSVRGELAAPCSALPALQRDLDLKLVDRAALFGDDRVGMADRTAAQWPLPAPEPALRDVPDGSPDEGAYGPGN